jgi:hypothetical protein
MKTLYCLILCLFLLSGCAAQTDKSHSASSIDYPFLRVFCTEDITQIDTNQAKFSIVQPLSFGSGQPWASYPQRKGFSEVIQKAKSFTDKGHQKGFTYISYISKTISGGPSPDELPLVKVYAEDLWAAYEDYFGPKPPKSPKDWIEKRADGSLGGYTWVSPSGKAGFHSFACANNPHFHRYMKGVVKALIDMGIDGFYLDHTEGKGCYCEYCESGFGEYLTNQYPQNFVTKKYNLSAVADLKLPKSDRDPLWIEWRKFISASQVELHQILKNEATRLGDTDFIVSGNLFGAGGFGFAALNGSDIEMAGDIDVILYSEIVPSTTNKEEAYLTIPGFRENTRVSNSPLYKHMTFAHHQRPVLVYPYYPESPNPVQKESALYNTQRLIVAECFANHTSMRRVQHNHKKSVRDASKNVYELLHSVENSMKGAKLYSNVAIITSLNQFYHGYYSYMYSASRMLNDAGISHTMLTERDLDPANLENLNVLILPYLPLLSKTSENEIQTFINHGGTAILIGPCGLKDQYGMVKDKSILMTMLDDGEVPQTTVQKQIGQGTVIYLPVSTDQLNQFSELLQTYNNDESEGYTISIFQHRVFGRGQFHDHLKDIWAQIPAIISNVVGDNLSGTLSTPKSAELTTMTSPDGSKRFAHIINYHMTEDGLITPLSNSEVSLRIPKTSSVTQVSFASLASPTPGVLKHEVIDRGDYHILKFTINHLELYGIAIIDLK